jgi:hypothetical protein
MALPAQRTAVSDTVLDVEDEAAGRFGRTVHRPRERQKPVNVAIRMYAAVRSCIGVGWTREEQIYAVARQSRYQLAGVSEHNALVEDLMKKAGARRFGSFGGLMRCCFRVKYKLKRCFFLHFVFP